MCLRLDHNALQEDGDPELIEGYGHFYAHLLDARQTAPFRQSR